jgi:hypothetical protein
LQGGYVDQAVVQNAVLLIYIKYIKKYGINNYAALRNAESENPGRMSQTIPDCLPRWTRNELIRK